MERQVAMAQASSSAELPTLQGSEPFFGFQMRLVLLGGKDVKSELAVKLQTWSYGYKEKRALRKK